MLKVTELVIKPELQPYLPSDFFFLLLQVAFLNSVGLKIIIAWLSLIKIWIGITNLNNGMVPFKRNSGLLERL